MIRIRRVAGVLILMALLGVERTVCGEPDRLEQDFLTPPPCSRPWVWFRWQGPVSLEGLDADLDAIAEQHFGGFVLDFSDGKVLKDAKIAGGPAFGSEAFFDLLFYTLEGARQRGLQVSIMPQNGWATAGGSWVEPEHQEQVLVWDEAVVNGPSVANVSLRPPLTSDAFYKDIAVLAFPVDRLPEPPRFRSSPPIVTADLVPADSPNGYWNVDPQSVVDGKPGSLISLRIPGKAKPSQLTLTFREPFEADSLYLHPGPSYINNLSRGQFRLEVSDDGTDFKEVHSFAYDPDQQNGTGGFTVKLPQRTQGLVWRLLLTAQRFPNHAWLAEVELLLDGESPSVLARIPFGDARAGGASWMPEGVADSLWSKADSVGTDPSRVIDLSDRMTPDGNLVWNAPAGHWVIARIGATGSGESTSAVGRFWSTANWEANKYSAKAARAFLAGFFDRLVTDPRAKLYLGSTLAGLHMDSWECSHHLWSDEVRATWQKTMPYELEKWMPALLGFTVESPALTRRFLWDYHRMLANLSGDEFVKAIRDRAHELGLFLQTEFPMHDRFKTFEYTDVPITEFSPKGDDGRAGMLKEGIQEGAKMTSSAAHIYGKTVTASEAFLAREKIFKKDHLSAVLGARDDGIRKFDRDPYALKSAGDKMFAQGVNRLILHLFLHQPFGDKKPGLTTSYGTNFGRNLIWWEMAGAWADYLTRCQFMQQQGIPQADFLFCLGEDALPRRGVGALSEPEYGYALESGYDFDFCTGQNVINLCSIQNGKIILPSGVTYELLVLGDFGGEITFKLLSKVAELVDQGATVLAPPGLTSPSLADFAEGNDSELKRLASALWGGIDGVSVKEHPYGRGRVLWGYTVPDALRAMDIVPACSSSESSVEFSHRRFGSDDFFFLTSQSDLPLQADCRFRVHGKVAEFWHPDTGRIEAVRAATEDSGGLSLSIDFPPNGSVFVVFRDKPSEAVVEEKPLSGRSLALDGPWQVCFSSPFGEVQELSFNALSSWSVHSDRFIKTFSGTASYQTEFQISTPVTGAVLDLGMVWNMGVVSVNGKRFEPLWKPPFRLDISDALVSGTNTLRIDVVNTWVNRVVGDLSLPEDQRKTWMTINPHKVTSPLRPAGLLGPVRLEWFELESK